MYSELQLQNWAGTDDCAETAQGVRDFCDPERTLRGRFFVKKIRLRLPSLSPAGRRTGRIRPRDNPRRASREWTPPSSGVHVGFSPLITSTGCLQCSGLPVRPARRRWARTWRARCRRRGRPRRRDGGGAAVVTVKRWR